jgi:DNA-binding HxlR family transcriptional regulator
MSASRERTYSCPVQLAFDIVGGKWKRLILWLLRGGGPRRFNDLLKAMPDVTHKVLTQQFRQLERDGLVSRTIVGEHVRVEYRLTAFGATLRPALNERASWAKPHHGRFGAALSPARTRAPGEK